MSNFSAEIFFWTILQLWLHEIVWNYYIHQKEYEGIDAFEILNSWNTLYHFLYIQLVF